MRRGGGASPYLTSKNASRDHLRDYIYSPFGNLKLHCRHSARFEAGHDY